MPRVRLQLGAREHRLPGESRILQSFHWHIRGAATFKRATLRKISFEPGRVDFQTPNSSRRAKFDDGPVVAGPAPPFCFPTVAHVHGPSWHDQVMPMSEKHVAA